MNKNVLICWTVTYFPYLQVRSAYNAILQVFVFIIILPPDIPTNENVKGTINANETTKLGLTDTMQHEQPSQLEIEKLKILESEMELTISHKSGKHMTLNIN